MTRILVIHKEVRMLRGLAKRREQIFEELGEIRRLRRGKLVEQYNKKQEKDGRVRRWGPYYTLQCWLNGKNRSQRVPRERAEQVQADVEAYERFQRLVEELASVTEQMTKKEGETDAKKKPKRLGRKGTERSRDS